MLFPLYFFLFIIVGLFALSFMLKAFLKSLVISVYAYLRVKNKKITRDCEYLSKSCKKGWLFSWMAGSPAFSLGTSLLRPASILSKEDSFSRKTPSNHMLQLSPCGYLDRNKFDSMILFCNWAAKRSWDVLSLIFSWSYAFASTFFLCVCGVPELVICFTFIRINTSLFLLRENVQTCGQLEVFIHCFIVTLNR